MPTYVILLINKDVPGQSRFHFIYCLFVATWDNGQATFEVSSQGP